MAKDKQFTNVASGNARVGAQVGDVNVAVDNARVGIQIGGRQRPAKEKDKPRSQD